MSQQSEINMSV